MKPALDLRQSQRLTMTPQLQQAIRLLQMTTTELVDELLHAQENNPLLEIVDESGEKTEERVEEAEFPVAATVEKAGDETTGSEVVETDAIEPDQLRFDNNEVAAVNDGDESGTDQVEWDDAPVYNPAYESRSRRETNDWQPDLAASAVSDTLVESLLAQSRLLFDNDQQRQIAGHIIQYIDDAGYIEVSLNEIRGTLDREVTLEETEQVLKQLQTLEPVGVAARSPEECLALQLAAMDPDEPGYHIACEIVQNFLPDLATRDFTRLRRRLGISESALRTAVDLIRHLNPHPGYSVGKMNINYITPDILVQKKGDHWYASLNSGVLPKLVINQNYLVLIDQSARNGAFSNMKEQVQNARWLLSSLEKRHQTILSVAKEIVERQQDFFHSGPEKMRPMGLRDIAEPLGVHESTVSRATSGKYMLTPGGVFELKYFFSSQLQTSHGPATSSIAIQTVIKKLIGQESVDKPVSDRKICDELNRQGYQVARRTVAKYREQMKIPPSSKRKFI